MNHKEDLNSILRLRLLYSTEKELSDLIGYQLKGNHFNHFKPFQSEAYFSKFAHKCEEYTRGKIDLEKMLRQYDNTSRFFQQHIENTQHETSKIFVPILLNHLFLGSTEQSGMQRSKDILVSKLYDEYNKTKEMNIGILLLMTYGILPTFKNKSSQDITNICDDFQKAYDILFDIANQHKPASTTKCQEILCLKEMRQLIEEERNGDKYLNRILLIHITNDVLNRIFALLLPAKLKQFGEELKPMPLIMPDAYWRCDDEPDNIVWECKKINGDAYYLYRNEIVYKTKEIRYTRYQLKFMDLGYKDLCYTFIMQPIFNYNNMLKREQPGNSLSFDYTEIEYNKDGVKQLNFTQHSPFSDKPLVLNAIKKEGYYDEYLSHTGRGEGYEDVDAQIEYDIDYEVFEVAVSQNALVFRIGGDTFKIDKTDSDGNETIPGINALSHRDNYLIAKLIENGEDRIFLCLDSINQNLDINDLENQPYFHPITQIEDLW